MTELNIAMHPELPKILCIDDETSILAALTRILDKDFNVLTASTFDSARDLLDQHRDTAIVLSDHSMPGMSGLEFLGYVQSAVPDAVRALLSGHIDISEMVAAINSSRIHRFILKPWDNDYLRLQMVEALAAHGTLREKRELERLSITDPVTLLRNHRFFQDHLRIEVDRAIRHERPMSLVMIDIDHFKMFNDQFGHQAGDAILRAVAVRMNEQVRTLDTVARYGGEEFTIIMPDTNQESAFLVAERLRLAFEKDPIAAGIARPTFVTISLGIASIPTHSNNAVDLIRAADSALYQAKRQGRNQSVGANSTTA
jgi:diguanylate cyclase (GGDEF)-like protein